MMRKQIECLQDLESRIQKLEQREKSEGDSAMIPELHPEEDDFHGECRHEMQRLEKIVDMLHEERNSLHNRCKQYQDDISELRRQNERLKGL